MDKIIIVVSKEVFKNDIFKNIEVLNGIHKNNIHSTIQINRLGTGHSAKVGARFIHDNFPHNLINNVVVMNGDSPLVSVKTLEIFCSCNCPAVAACHINDPKGYGRVFTQENGSLERIVEEKDATEEEKKNSFVNAGIYSLNFNKLMTQNMSFNNSQKESYLPDFLEPGDTIINCSMLEAFNVNNPEDLEIAKKFYS